MQRENRSWRNVIYGITLVILIFLIVFILLMSNSYRKQLREAYSVENSRAVQTWSNTMESRLGAVYGHNYEIALALYNNTELKSGTPAMQYSVRKKIADAISDKAEINQDLDFLFVLDLDGGDLIFSKRTNTNIAPSQINSVKQYIRKGEYQTISVHEKTWNIVEIDGISYFYQALRIGKYVVGSMCRLTNFDMTDTMHILGSHSGCAVISEDRICYMAGEDLFGEGSVDSSGNVALPTASEQITRDFPLANARLLLAVRGDETLRIYSSSLRWMVVSGAASIVLLLILIAVLSRLVAAPMEQMLKATREVQDGNLEYQMPEKWGSREFDTLTGSFNSMVRQIRNLKINAYDMEIQKQHDELTMLRAQIQPHFYLNAITTVSNMTYQDRNADIRSYVSALAKFMRYMLNLRSKMIPLGDEILHIDNYLRMQSIKFPDSVHAEVNCPEEAKTVEIPYLLLFTVVENTFKHAMDLYHPLELRIECSVQEGEDPCCRILVTDNGKGFSAEVLELFRPGTVAPDAKEHLGLSNVSRTLMLVYGREDLLRLRNNPEGGACVELCIPLTHEKTRSEDIHETADL